MSRAPRLIWVQMSVYTQNDLIPNLIIWLCKPTFEKLGSIQFQSVKHAHMHLFFLNLLFQLTPKWFFFLVSCKWAFCCQAINSGKSLCSSSAQTFCTFNYIFSLGCHPGIVRQWSLWSFNVWDNQSNQFSWGLRPWASLSLFFFLCRGKCNVKLWSWL